MKNKKKAQKNKNEKQERKFYFLFAIIVVFLPLVLDWCVFANDVPSNITNGEWAGFLGGYIGAVLGGFFSLLGIAWTIHFTRKESKKDRELQIRPYMDIRYLDTEQFQFAKSWLGYVKINVWDESGGETKEVGAGLLYLKNVGNGAATNINISAVAEGIDGNYNIKFTNKNRKVTTNSISPQEETAMSIMVLNTRKAPSKEELIWDENGFADYDISKYVTPSNFVLKIKIEYSDLLTNRFEQEIVLRAGYEMNYEKQKGGKYICMLDIMEKGMPRVIE